MDLNQFDITNTQAHELATAAKHRNFGGKVFYNLRKDLDLSPLSGLSDFVGLHTLLDSAQLDFRKTTIMFLLYLTADLGNIDRGKILFELTYPDLFLKYPLQNKGLPDFAKPWVATQYVNPIIRTKDLKRSLVNFGIVNAGQKPDISRIVGVVKALFEVLDSDNLLDNFLAITKEASDDFEDSQTLAAANPQSITDGQLLSKNFRAFVYQFWVEVIGSNNKEQLRYYLRSMLAFVVVPPMIGHVLESGKSADPAKPNEYEDTLKLIRQIHEIPGFKAVVKAHHGSTGEMSKYGSFDGALEPAHQIHDNTNFNDLTSAYRDYAPNYF
ncbi:hypothetical protein H4R34_002687, partial [Dimargaris verticillata]